MKVSIITVVYNNADTIQDAIDSVIKQDYNNIEYIVVDGQSTDGTYEIIESYRDYIDTFISEKDRGLYDAINKGIRNASGDVVGILNSDDFYVNRHVISQVVHRMKEQATDCVYADLCYVDKHQTDKVIRKWKSGTFKRKRFLNGWMPPHPTFFVRKEHYDQLGLYDTNFCTSADYELMLRFLYKHQLSVDYIPDELVKMRTGGASNGSLKQRIIANKEDAEAWKKNNLQPRFYTRFAKPASKLMQYVPSII